MDRIIKIVLAILLFICLADMPYGFYELVRFLALIGFGVLAYLSYEKKAETETVIFIGLAILFQPLFKIALGKPLWNIIDIVVAVGLVISLIKKK